MAISAVGASIAGVRRSRRRAAAEQPRTIRPAEWPPLIAVSNSQAEPATALASADDPAAGDPAPWVEPTDAQCPVTHPVKGNASSGIYHVPGSRFYAMTIPERCYRDAAAAEADGMRAPKR